MLTLTNYSPHPFTGWLPPAVVPAAEVADGQVGWTAGGVEVIVGPPVGDGLNRVAHVYAVDLKPGNHVVNGLRAIKESDYIPTHADAASTAFGAPFLNGTPMKLVANETRGAMVRTTYRHDVWTANAHAFHIDVCLEFHPGTGVGNWEALIVAGDTANADWDQDVAFPIQLSFHRWGGQAEEQGLTYVLGKGYGVALLSSGDVMGVGQGRAFTGTVLWLSQIEDAPTAASALAMCERHVHARLLGAEDATFGPLLVPAKGGPDAMATLRRSIQEALNDLHNWTAHSSLGTVTDTKRTGGVEDQGWTQASEFFQPSGNGHQHLRYLLALSSFKRPIHFRNPMGLPLTDDEADGLVCWDGRPHWHPQMSPNRLGRTGDPPYGWAHGWSGPDRQHDLIHTLAAASILNGSPFALQRHLEDHARLYLWSDHTDPRYITSGADAARSAGWAALKIAWLWRALDDRELAAKVRDRFLERVTEVYTEHMDRHGGAPLEIWDEIDDPRIWHDMNGRKDYSGAWMPYQQAVAAGGLQIAGEVFDHEPTRALAYRLADTVVRYGYTYTQGQDPVEWDFVAYDRPDLPLPAGDMRQGQGAHRSGWFADAWFPFAAWTVLRHTPGNDYAQRIYAACERRMTEAGALQEWLPPL